MEKNWKKLEIMQKKKSENTLTTEPILQTIQTVPIWSRAECSVIVGWIIQKVRPSLSYPKLT
jgi:hypothetical protein